ncbi:MAG: hypothetical protein GTO51_08375 [Candidatus Latescibacteria bacterium]|nr:hypothetical protein [Candidatus Latescibacterota bacterium]NIM21968.1 hypothetical protein [Candidatus Latescibacterota bacterium]NIM65986.1 hypothetical protein [Candidatus Latescibacterota bacterium]NIO02394.1 hypothetical protein [Candidatus Latescibacterota bacterium]NIO29304.1 hypothetical protein [Candidatus Latescibacterota bacterium]
MSETEGKHPPAEIADEESAPDLQKVMTVMKCLTKYVAGMKIYAKNNPTLAKFAGEFRDAMQEFFEDEDELVLSIEQFAVKWQDEIVYENEKRDESLAFIFFRDGIGEVTLTKGVTEEELDRFVEIIKQEFHSTADEEDIVTKLWKTDFRFIAYRVLEEYLSGEYGDGEGQEHERKPSRLDFDDHEESRPSLEDRGRVIVEPDDPIQSIDGYMRSLAQKECQSGDEVEKEAAFQRIAEDLLKVAEEDLNDRHEQLRFEKGSESLMDFMDAFLSFTLLSHNPAAVRDVTNVTERFVDYVLEERRLKTLAGTLALIREFMGGQSIPDDIASLCRSFEDRLCDDALLSDLAHEIKEWNKKSNDIVEYLLMAGQKSLTPLCEVLRQVEGQKVHREICNAIVTIAGKNIAAIVDRFEVDSAAIAFDIIYMLSMANPEGVSPKIRELIHYPDSLVKAEVIEYLGGLEGEEVIPILFEALEDPEKTIRLKALEALERIKSPSVLDKISMIAFGKEFTQKSMDEQEAVFKTLGRLGNEETVDRIGKMLEKRHLLHFSKNRGNKYLAIHALENICTDSSQKLLEKLSKDSSSQVRGRAYRARKHLRKLMENPQDNAGKADSHD